MHSLLVQWFLSPQTISTATVFTGTRFVQAELINYEQYTNITFGSAFKAQHQTKMQAQTAVEGLGGREASKLPWTIEKRLLL